MKITVQNIVDSHMAISELMKSKLPANIGYELALLSNRMSGEYIAWDQMNKTKIMQYGKDHGQGHYKVDPKNMEKYMNEIIPVLQKEVEVDIPDIKISDLKDTEGKSIYIEPIHLANLAWLIKR